MTVNEEMTGLDQASLTRRRLLQAGIASGVVVAAWSLPQVTAVAQTLPTGFVCTAPVKKFSVPFDKNMKCSSDCPDYVTYLDQENKALDVQINFVGSVPGCSNPNSPFNGAQYTLTGSGFDGFVCRIQTVHIEQPNGDNPVAFSTETFTAPNIAREPSNFCDYQLVGVDFVCCPEGNFHGTP